MKIDFANLQHQYQLYKDEIDEAINKVLNNSNYIMGAEVGEFELSLQKFTKSKHAISCSNGTDALVLALMALDIKPGDEVITPPFTFISSAETISFIGATPVFVDIDEKTYNINHHKIEEAITQKTKAIIPVNLYGQPADIDPIIKIANKYNLKVILDGAQCFGSTYKNKSAATYGDMYTTSFFPAKPLGCYGDGGAVFTDSDDLAKKIKSLRVHGQDKRYHHDFIGMTGRLDTLQAAVLNVKLRKYSNEIIMRNNVASMYSKYLSDIEKVVTPSVISDRKSVWAQYTIRVKNREKLGKKLQEYGIPTAIHYPIPLHMQNCFKYLNIPYGAYPVSEKISQEVISLPMNPFVSEEEIKYIADKIRNILN